MGSSSSWVEQVLVHGAHKDANDHPITKVASCAIATEDVEVNIVSKEFLENHLGFSESSFLELKGTEKRGAVGIATYSRIPEGAINLTWYHREGSRVFRDMRFLIVPHSHADLVIGATSALKYDIVTKQDLMVAKVGQYQGLMTIGNKTKDEEWKELHRAFNLRNEELKNIRTRQAQARVDKKSKEELEQIDRDYRECKAKYDVDEKRFAICHAERKNTSKELLDEIKEDLDKLVKKTKPEVEDFEAAVDSET